MGKDDKRDSERPDPSLEGQLDGRTIGQIVEQGGALAEKLSEAIDGYDLTTIVCAFGLILARVLNAATLNSTNEGLRRTIHIFNAAYLAEKTNIDMHRDGTAPVSPGDIFFAPGSKRKDN